MDFLQKLDYLLKFTKTTDDLLASSISLDATYFSRLRADEKAPARDAGYIRSIATFLSIRCSEKRQTQELLSALHRSGAVLPSTGKLEDLIYQWLSSDAHVNSSHTRNGPEHKQDMSCNGAPASENQPDPNAPVLCGTEVYYGNEGRRQASIKLLCEVLKTPTPNTLLLLSEENLDWMTENSDYMATWGALLQQALIRGNRIKIIHHICRGMDDMLVAIKQWMPIYLSGMVEPYYNPKVSEIFFRRTLFVAPGCATIFSNSVVGGPDNTANYLVRDKKGIENAVSEFEAYLAFCQPLFHICGEDKLPERRKKLEAFDHVIADTFFIASALADLPIPAEVIELTTRCLDADERERIISLHQSRLKIFEDILSQKSVHIVLSEPDMKSYNKRLKPLIYSRLACQYELAYTDEMFRLQLQFLIHMLKRYDNFHIYLTDTIKDDYVIYGKVGIGALITKVKAPTICFSVNENHLTTALWHYMLGAAGKAFGNKENKKQTIKKLEALLKQL